jgi:hypothetical protein
LRFPAICHCALRLDEAYCAVLPSICHPAKPEEAQDHHGPSGGFGDGGRPKIRVPDELAQIVDGDTAARDAPRKINNRISAAAINEAGSNAAVLKLAQYLARVIDSY